MMLDLNVEEPLALILRCLALFQVANHTLKDLESFFTLWLKVLVVPIL